MPFDPILSGRWTIVATVTSGGLSGQSTSIARCVCWAGVAVVASLVYLLMIRFGTTAQDRCRRFFHKLNRKKMPMSTTSLAEQFRARQVGRDLAKIDAAFADIASHLYRHGPQVREAIRDYGRALESFRKQAELAFPPSQSERS